MTYLYIYIIIGTVMGLDFGVEAYRDQGLANAYRADIKFALIIFSLFFAAWPVMIFIMLRHRVTEEMNRKRFKK